MDSIVYLLDSSVVYFMKANCLANFQLWIKIIWIPILDSNLALYIMWDPNLSSSTFCPLNSISLTRLQAQKRPLLPPWGFPLSLLSYNFLLTAPSLMHQPVVMIFPFPFFILILNFFNSGATPSSAHRLLLVLCSEVTPKGLVVQGM